MQEQLTNALVLKIFVNIEPSQFLIRTCNISIRLVKSAALPKSNETLIEHCDVYDILAQHLGEASFRKVLFNVCVKVIFAKGVTESIAISLYGQCGQSASVLSFSYAYLRFHRQ